MDQPLRVAILVYGSVELLDMNGPLDTFVKANRFNNGRYQVYTVAVAAGSIQSEKGALTITPQYDITNCPEPDLIVIPGIIDAQVPDTLTAWILEMGQKGKQIMSVCIGFFILAKTGLLSGKQATTHYLAFTQAEQEYPDVRLVKNVRFVRDGAFITTAGITSGIDGALAIVEAYDGSAIAQQTADVLIYNRDAPLPPYTLLPPYNRS